MPGNGQKQLRSTSVYELIDAAIESIPDVQSIVFYVRDPILRDELRLVHMNGVRHREPMYGFLFPTSTRERITQGEPFELLNSASTHWKLVDPPTEPLASLTSTNRLFGNFAVREDVVSCARLLNRERDTTTAILFVNFSSEVQEHAVRSQLESLLAELCSTDRMRQVQSRMSEETIGASAHYIHIARTTEQFAAVDHDSLSSQQTLQHYLDQFLSSISEVFLRTAGGVATLHLFDRDKAQLLVAAHTPYREPVRRSQNIKTGEGVVSWVALKKRAILIEDTRSSAFRDSGIYCEVYPETRSELAVPMLVGDQLIGVLNLESSQPGEFLPHDVRTLWYAATQAAIIIRLISTTVLKTTIEEWLNSLLRVFQSACLDLEEEQSPLNELANLLRGVAGADMCDIWRFDRGRNQFVDAGVSERKLMSPNSPRFDGWTNFAVKSRRIVWLSDIKAKDEFTVATFRADDKQLPRDDTPNSKLKYPQTLNESLLNLQACCELGFPVLVHGEPIALAWLKYRKALGCDPTPYFLGQIHQFIATIGLVLDFVERYATANRMRQTMFEERVIEFRNRILPEPVADERFEIHVRHEPFEGRIGGDFYWFGFLDQEKRLLAVIVGDGESHGFPGALHMLPLLTAFEILQTQRTSSTHYVLQKMNDVACSMGLRGTALYFIVDLGQSPQVVLSASNAGHPPLIVFDRDAKNRDFPEKKSDRRHFELGASSLLPPLGEELTHCNADDVIVACTDGIFDAGEAGDSGTFGRVGIVSAALPMLDASAEQIAEAIFQNAHARDVHDDVTILVVKLLGKK